MRRAEEFAASYIQMHTLMRTQRYFFQLVSYLISGSEFIAHQCSDAFILERFDYQVE